MADPRVNPAVPLEVHLRAKESIAQHMTSLGFKSKHMHPDTMYDMCTVYFGRDDATWLYPHNFIQWTDALQAKDPLGSLDEIEDAVMVSMVGLYLRGLGHALQQPRNIAKAWAPFAERALEEAGRLQEVEGVIKSWSSK